MSSPAQFAVTLVASAYQVKQRKKENPDNIHEVPVQTDDFNGRKIVWSKASPARTQNQPKQQPHANNHMERVQSGHRKVEDEVEFGVFEASRSQAGENRSLRGPVEAGNNVLNEFLVVLICLHAKKHSP